MTDVSHAYRHGSPEHWRARYEFRASNGYDIEDILEPGEYEVGPGVDGEPVVAVGVRGWRRIRDLTTNPSDLAWLDQMIAAMSDENQQLAQEYDHG